MMIDDTEESLPEETDDGGDKKSGKSNKMSASFQKFLSEYEAADDESYKESYSKMFNRYITNLYKVLHFIFYAAVPLYLKWFQTLIFPSNPKDVTKEIALVTGGGNGLGRAIVLELIGRGARVAICDINLKAAEETAEEARRLRKDKGVAFAYKTDVSDPEALRQLRKQILQDFGSHVTILFNNAGALVAMGILAGTDEDVRRVLDINCVAHFWTIRTFLPDMKARNHGHIVTISSLGSYRGMSFASAYCASKWAVRGLSETLRSELRQQKLKGIKITTVCPYLIATRKYLVDQSETSLAKLSPATAAFYAVDAMARNYEEITIPNFLIYILSLGALFPRSVVEYIDRTIFPVKIHNEKFSGLL